MKKNKRIFAAAAALTGILLSVLSGCGGKEDTGETKKPEGLIYVPQYAQIDMDKDSYVYAAAATGDRAEE